MPLPKNRDGRNYREETKRLIAHGVHNTTRSVMYAHKTNMKINGKDKKSERKYHYYRVPAV